MKRVHILIAVYIIVSQDSETSAAKKNIYMNFHSLLLFSGKLIWKLIDASTSLLDIIPLFLRFPVPEHWFTESLENPNIWTKVDHKRNHRVLDSQLFFSIQLCVNAFTFSEQTKPDRNYSSARITWDKQITLTWKRHVN